MQLTVPFETPEKTVDKVKHLVAVSNEFIRDDMSLDPAEVKVDLLVSRIESATDINKFAEVLKAAGIDTEVHFVEDDDTFADLANSAGLNLSMN